MEPTINERLLEQRFEALEASHTWHPRVISRIESHIRTSDDKGLFRMNPVRYAEERGMTEAEAIDLFRAASKRKGSGATRLTNCGMTGLPFTGSWE